MCACCFRQETRLWIRASVDAEKFRPLFRLMRKTMSNGQSEIEGKETAFKLLRWADAHWNRTLPALPNPEEEPEKNPLLLFAVSPHSAFGIFFASYTPDILLDLYGASKQTIHESELRLVFHRPEVIFMDFEFIELWQTNEMKNSSFDEAHWQYFVLIAWGKLAYSIIQYFSPW